MNFNHSPFLEFDFANAMELLEARLMDQPGWKDLIYYKNISGFDAGYSNFYWKFLEILRSHDNAKAQTAIIKEKRAVSFKNRINSYYHMVKHREITFSQGLRIIGQRMSHQVKIHLNLVKISQVKSSHKALVIRSYGSFSPFPVLQRLAAEPDWQVIFAGWDQRLEKPVSEIGAIFLNLKYAHQRKYNEIQKEHAREINKLLTRVDPYLPVKILGEMLHTDVSYNATDLITREFISTRVHTDIFMDLIDRIRPDILVLLNENTPPQRLAGLVAKTINVPSVFIQHGLFIGYVYPSLATDHILVWGTEPKKFWLNIGCKPEQVIEVGAFPYESWMNKSPAHLQFPQKDTRPRVLVLGQNPAAFISASMHAETIAAVFQAIQVLPNYYFIVKPHPGENPVPYHLESEKLLTKENFEILNSGPIEQVIMKSDLVITVFSTAGLEAMFLGKPVLVLNLSEEPPLAPYVGAAELVTSAQLLPKAIQKILDNSAYQQSLIKVGKKYAESYLGVMDGRAIHRAVDAIKNLAMERAER